MIAINPEEWPKYVEPRTLAGGRIAYYWNPPGYMLKGPPPFPLTWDPLGQDAGVAKDKGHALNRQLDHWRRHGRLPDDPAASGSPQIIWGSVDEAWATYRAANPTKRRAYERLPAKTRKDYDRGLAAFADYRLDNGKGPRLGEQLCADIDAALVDRVYEKLSLKFPEGGAHGPPQLRRRSANLWMAACRKAWKTAARATPDRVPAVNPFEKMDLDTSTAFTRPANRLELDAFTAKAIELGWPEVAFAAQAAFDLLQRPIDICPRKDGTYPGFSWAHWRPAGRPDHVQVVHHKTDVAVWKPAGEYDAGGNWISFYPELEAIVAQIPRRGLLLVMLEHRKGRAPKDRADDRPIHYVPYHIRTLRRRAEEVRTAAGLDPHVTLTSFRHGGMTELGDAELSDTLAMALSRHKDRRTLTRYIHPTEKQQLAASRLRLAHRQENKG